MFYTKNKISVTIASIIVVMISLLGATGAFISGAFTGNVGFAGYQTKSSDFLIFFPILIIYIVFGLVMSKRIPFYWFWVAIIVPYFLFMLVAVFQTQ